MPSYCLTIQYDGTAYCGWQVQPQVPTVQGTIEAVLQKMTQAPCRLRAAGRTDAGVHAQGQIASFYTASAIPPQGFFRGLNALLPQDIAISAIQAVSPDFDARRHNHGKHYRYTICHQKHPSPEQARRALHVYGALDLAAMAQAAQRLVGRHNFAAFRAASCERETTVRTLYRCTVTRRSAAVTVDVEGTAFLKNMVRIITGTLLEVGQGRRSAGSLVELLKNGDRTEAGITAPAHGLCLMRVFSYLPGSR